MLVMPSSEHWAWGARPDPLWNPDLEGFDGRVKRNGSWDFCRLNLIAEGRRVHDFYFHVTERDPSAENTSAEDTVRDELLVWSFGDRPDTGRIDVVSQISDADHASIRAYLAEAFQSMKARLGGDLGGIGWEADGREFKKRGWFFDNIRAASFEKFRDEIGEADARNLIFDVHVVPIGKAISTVRIWMTHPGRGASREILIEDVTDADLVTLTDMIASHYSLHRRHFGWVLTGTGAD